MQMITVKGPRLEQSMLVIPLVELYGPTHTALHLGEFVGYTVPYVLRATVGIADGLLGNTTLTRECIERYLCHEPPANPRPLAIRQLTELVWVAANRILVYVPEDTVDLLYCCQRHNCVYMTLTTPAKE